MTKTRVRSLWMQVKFENTGDASNDRVLRTLKRSIERGDYQLPRGWRVQILWRNKDGAEMRSGEWKAELTASAQSSDGFDKCVLNYIDRQRGR